MSLNLSNSNRLSNSYFVEIDKTNNNIVAIDNEITGINNEIAGIGNDIAGIGNDITGINNRVTTLEIGGGNTGGNTTTASIESIQDNVPFPTNEEVLKTHWNDDLLLYCDFSDSLNITRDCSGKNRHGKLNPLYIAILNPFFGLCS